MSLSVVMKWVVLALVGVAAVALTVFQPAKRLVPQNALVIGQTSEPKALDPHVVTALNDFRILNNIYEGLVRFRPGTLEIMPGLARAWEVSADGRTYTFQLRRDVRFHDGTPFDAAAVKFNFDRLLNPASPYHDTGPFPLAFFFKAIKRIEIIDRHTIRFYLDSPFAPLLSNLAYPTGFMVSPRAVKRYGRGLSRHPSGTGPFRLERWESGVRVVLKRNPDYWSTPPRLDAVIFRPLRNANTRVAELLTGSIDVLVEVPADVLGLLRGLPDVRLVEKEGPHLWFLILNTRHGPFRDRRMRLAVNYAINKQAIVDALLQGGASVAAGPVPRAFGWAHDPGTKPFPHDPERARRLIRVAGHENAKLVLYASQGGSGMLEPMPMATAIQADLAAVGLQVEIRAFEWNSYLDRVNDGLDKEADMAEMAWMTNDPDTLPFLALRSAAMPEQGGFNAGYYANPELDRLIEQARRTTDRDERARLYKALQRLARRDPPWAYVASWKQAVAAQGRVSGLRLEPSFLLDLKGVSKTR